LALYPSPSAATGCCAAGTTLGKPTLAHLIRARARKATTDKISVSAHEVNSVRSEKGEQFLGKNGPQVEWAHPGITLCPRRNVPSCPINLRMAIVVVRRFDSDFSMQRRYRAHDVEPFSARAGKQLKVGVEDIERQDSVRLQMASHRGKEGRKFILLAQVKK
jgi:hypothetical protein